MMPLVRIAANNMIPWGYWIFNIVISHHIHCTHSTCSQSHLTSGQMFFVALLGVLMLRFAGIQVRELTWVKCMLCFYVSIPAAFPWSVWWGKINKYLAQFIIIYFFFLASMNDWMWTDITQWVTKRVEETETAWDWKWLWGSRITPLSQAAEFGQWW